MNLQPMESAEFAPLADRLGLLQLVRAAIVVFVMAATALAPRAVGMRASDAARVTAAYAIVTLITELWRQSTRNRALQLVQIVVLLDSVYLAAILAPIGASYSVLVFLVYLHLVAVTLLMSHRTGLKIALWQSLLMVVAQWAAVTGVAARPFGMATVRVADSATVALGTAAFLVVAIGTAAFSSLAERELRRGKAEMVALAVMARDLERTWSPGEVGRLLVDHACRTFGFASGAVVAIAPHQEWRDASNDDVVRRCRDALEPLLVKRLDPGANPVLDSLLPDARNVVVAPLVAEGNVLAVLVLVRGGGAGATVRRTTVAGVSSFVAHAALALRNAWLLEEVERLARTDPLTGLANRRTFEGALQREVARSVRSGDPVSLVVLDVDHFKTINDTAGHQAGDDVLRHIGRVLADHAREMDLPARFGGEEFCVVLPACPPSQAVAVAERLRAGVADYAGPVTITASAGVASLPVHAVDASGLLAAADEALYDSKKAGRDRTSMSTRKGVPVRLLA